MAKKAKSTQNESAEPAQETTQEATQEATQNTQPRGPVLSWNADRDRALAQALADGTRRKDDLVTALRGHEAFADVPDALVTGQKIQNRMRILRQAGVNVPHLDRTRYSPDSGALNEILGS